MIIGCPKEIKNNENRVGLTPNAAQAYKAAGHNVLVEAGAGAGSGCSDAEYAAAGAQICRSADEIWAKADMIVKVKEPLPAEYPKMRAGQIIYTFFHFAADRELTEACLKQEIIGIAYETVAVGGSLPLLKPMSEVAGRMSALMGAFYLAGTQGGRGVLPMGATGTAPANVLVLGGGTVGANAARVAAGLGAQVRILDVNLARLEYLGEIMPPNIVPLYSDAHNLAEGLAQADYIIGAVLIPGAKAPKLIKREMLKNMRRGAVLVDVAIDQGGCFETSRPTSHSDPVYELDGIIHYCVTNMPGAYARTSAFALNIATLPYGLLLAEKGAQSACRENAALRAGLNLYKGKITYKAVADALNMERLYKAADEILGG